MTTPCPRSPTSSAPCSAPEDLTLEIARRYRARDAARPLPSVSFGIAAAEPGDDVAAAMTRADVALYQAKAAGRGCAVRYDGHRPVVTGSRPTD